jgi:hypothetical protein
MRKLVNVLNGKQSKPASLFDCNLNELDEFADYVKTQTTLKIMRTIENKIIDHVLDNSCWQLCDYTDTLQEIVNLLSAEIEAKHI